jgi:hypothetical protein
MRVLRPGRRGSRVSSPSECSKAETDALLQLFQGPRTQPPKLNHILTPHLFAEQARRPRRFGPERRLQPRTPRYALHFRPRLFLPSSHHTSAPAVFTLSGTLGAAYVAVGRGIPAVAFSAGNSTKRSYKDWDPEDPTDIGEWAGGKA